MNIGDYTERLSGARVSAQVDKFKSLEQTQREDSAFRIEMKKKISDEISGKVSSSEISYPSTIKDEISRDPYKKKLYNSTVEFESIFVKMMLSQMKKSISKSGLIDGGRAEEIFDDMLYDEYAKIMSNNEKFGLAEQVYEKLSYYR